ncbi:MAG: (Fe-S)-binding protein [Acidobacteriota bacterium]
MTIGGESITRVILDNVPRPLELAFYAAAFVSCGLAALLLARRMLLHRRGRGDGRDQATSRRPLQALGAFLRYVTFHEQLLRDRYAGIAHLLMFHGFFILFVGTCLVFLEHDTPLHFFYGRFYLIASLIIDLGGVAFLAGLIMFISRRLRRRTVRILDAWWVGALAWLLLGIGVSGFLLEGARIAQHLPAFERWSVVGYGTALALRSAGLDGGAAMTWHRVLWSTHALLCIAFFALLPWKFFAHMVYGGISWALRRRALPGTLRPARAGDRAPGAVTTADLPWRDLLQADACTTCGLCDDACPANAAGKPLRPREVVLGLRAALDGKAAPDGPAGARDHRPHGTPLAAHITDEAIWSCTTCMACNESCPVGIEIFDKIVEIRRGRIETGIVPESAERVFEGSAAAFNPYGRPAEERIAWASGLDLPVAREDEPIELLYWIGCAGSFDPDGRSVSRAMIRILNHLGIRYHILGRRERCTGDPARRMGEEGLFLEQARGTINLLSRHRVVRVLTHCPHCFNTFANEYPALGARLEVEHHSRFLARMIREGRLRLPSGDGSSITFHDPCYMARGNGETRAPREILSALPGAQILEMPRHGEHTFCCGAGGGAMWLDVPGKTRVENLRAREAAETGASIVATGCPFCKSMLEAGKQSLDDGGAGLRVKDLAELIVEAEGL